MDFKRLRDFQLLAVMAINEAGNQGLEGMAAVCCVARNRVRHPDWWGADWWEVILKPYQFSCFLPTEKNYPVVVATAQKILDGVKDPIIEEAKWLATGVINDLIRDSTKGADHYCRYDCWPDWRKVYPQVARIGDHVFYRSHGRNK